MGTLDARVTVEGDGVAFEEDDQCNNEHIGSENAYQNPYGGAHIVLNTGNAEEEQKNRNLDERKDRVVDDAVDVAPDPREEAIMRGDFPGVDSNVARLDICCLVRL